MVSKRFFISLLPSLVFAIVDAEAVRGNVAAPIDSTYKLVFDDEFNGGTVDTSKWNLLTNNSIGGGYAQDTLAPGNAIESGGFLSLLSSRQANNSRPYRAEFIVGKQAWSYGYWETRGKMPSNGRGIWPAFWMNNCGTYPEIDIFEWIGNDPKQLWVTYHPKNDPTLTGGTGFGTIHKGPDYSATFHVYGMWWQPNSLTWFIDGMPVFQLKQGQQYNGKTVNLPGAAMETIFTASVGGWNKNFPDRATVFPANFVIDYLHIYSNSLKAEAVTPQSGYGGSGDSTGSGFKPPVYQAPAFTSIPLSVTTEVNSVYTFTVKATGNPAPVFSVASGALPPGLTLFPSGVISGRPTATGTYTGKIAANDGIDLAVTQSFSIGTK